MLILKLYPGQTIWVGKDIQITVLGNLQEFVRMGVQIRQLQNIKVGEKNFGIKSDLMKHYQLLPIGQRLIKNDLLQILHVQGFI